MKQMYVALTLCLLTVPGIAAMKVLSRGNPDQGEFPKSTAVNDFKRVVSLAMQPLGNLSVKGVIVEALKKHSTTLVNENPLKKLLGVLHQENVQELQVKIGAIEYENLDPAVHAFSAFLEKEKHLGAFLSMLEQPGQALEEVLITLHKEHPKAFLSLLHSAYQLKIEPILTTFFLLRERNNACDMTTSFLEAAAAGDLASVQLLLTCGVSVDVPNEQGETALMHAAGEGHLEVVQLLLKYGANVTLQDTYKYSKRTALARAVKYPQIVTLLLDAGAQVNAVDYLLETALMGTAYPRAIESAKILLARGAEVDAQDSHGLTPLMRAAWYSNNTEMIKLLLRHGAKTELQNDEGKTALMYAATRSEIQELEVLLSECPNALNMQDQKGKTALMYAAIDCHAKMITALLDKGALINVQDAEGKTALMYAAGSFYAAKEDIVPLLMKRGAHIDTRDKQGFSALMHLIARSDRSEGSFSYDWRDTKLVEWLLSQGATVEVQAAFLLAASKGSERIMELFFKKGARVNEKDAQGTTALIKAVNAKRKAEDDLSDIRWLLDKGASVDEQDSEGKTALMHAVGNPKIVELLLARKAQATSEDKKGTTALMCAAMCGSVDSGRLLIQQGVQLDVRNSEGQTAFSFAAAQGHVSFIELLFKNNSRRNFLAELNEAFAKGQRALVECFLNHGVPCILEKELTKAAAAGKKDIVELLLDRGVSVDVQDEQGNTALYYASGTGKYGSSHKDIVALLLSRGARRDKMKAFIMATDSCACDIGELLIKTGLPVTTIDEQGMTLLMHAAQSYGGESLVSFILDNGASIEAQDKEGKTALMHAACRSHCEKSVALLLSRGAQLTKQDHEGRTALMHAAGGYKCRKNLSVLLKSSHSHELLTMRDKQGRTAFAYAASLGMFSPNTKALDLLLRRCEELGRPQLAKATESREATFEKTLLKFGLHEDIHVAFMTAVEKGDEPLVERLIQIGVQVNAPGGDGKTALVKAAGSCRAPHLKIMERLLKLSTPEMIQEACAEAADQGHECLVELCLNYGAKLDAPNQCGSSLLSSALTYGRYKVAELLLKRGAQRLPSTVEEALIKAVKEGDVTVVTMLLDQGADINTPSCWWYADSRPLMVASAQGNIPMVTLLLTRGADISLKDEEGSTAFTRAAEKGHTVIMELLLGHGAIADTKRALMSNDQVRAVFERLLENEKQFDKMAALRHALSSGDKLTAEWLFNSVKIDIQEALMLSASSGNSDLVRLCLERRADVNVPDREGKTALMVAAEAGGKEVVALLLEAGAHGAPKDSKGRDALYRASRKGGKELVELLLAKDPHLDLTSGVDGAFEGMHRDLLEFFIHRGAQIDKVKALMKAVYLGNIEKMQWCIDELGVHVDAQDEQGKTALMHAVKGILKGETVPWLLDRGARLDSQDNEGKTPLMHSIDRFSSSCCEMVELLIQRGAAATINRQDNKGDTALMLTYKHKVKELLLKHGALASVQNKEGRTPLMDAVLERKLKTVALLLKHHTPVKAHDHNGRTALMYAVECEELAIVQLLIDHGAPLSTQDNKGNTALILAARTNIEIVKLLLAEFSHIDYQNKEGETALMRAAECGKTDIVEELLAHGADRGLRNKDGHIAVFYAMICGRKDAVQALI